MTLVNRKTQSLPDISVFIIARDDGKTIEKTLKQAKRFARELIVIDYGSEDNTLSIAEKYADKIYKKQWLGIYRMKNFALTLCTYPWVMHLCADEVIRDSLIDEMKDKFGKQLAKGKLGFRFPRRFHVGNTFVRWAGFYPDHQLRIFKKNIAHFRGNSMDESVEIWDVKKERYLSNSSKVYTFTNAIDYYPFKTIKEMENYYYFNAEVGFKKISKFQAVVGSCGTFIEKFIFRFGFLSGGLGFKICKILAMRVWKQYKRASDPSRNYVKLQEGRL